MKRYASLLVLISGREPQEIALDGRRMRLGRSEECEIVIDESGVSRTHAVVFRAGSDFVIEDLGSRNGTFVNGERIERHRLGPGDRIRLAPTAELEFCSTRPHTVGPSARRGGSFRSVSYRLLPHEQEGGAVDIRSSVTTVGREGSGQVALRDASVSRLHARLDRDRSGLYVTDLKSRNGTRVNGSPTLRARLEDGDLVQFGNVVFRVEVRDRFAWRSLARIAGASIVLIGAGLAVGQWIERANESAAVARERERVQRQAVASVVKGIAAYREGDVDFAKSYLSYAADILRLADLAPENASLRQPNELFRGIMRHLPPSDRVFDFEKVFDPSALEASRRREIESLPTRDYVEYQCRLIAVELGQSRDVPEGFVNQVLRSIDAIGGRGFQTTLNRSRLLHPRLRELLREASLPEIFCYVAWVESGLSPTARSHVGAVGLWQFMPQTARLYGLRVESGTDERVIVDKSTRAAARYIGNLIRWFGREQFMCALASYNRGEGGVRNAMEKIPDPMMESSQKFWYLVEKRLLPRETSDYVPRIFAAKILAEAPERFGFHRP